MTGPKQAPPAAPTGAGTANGHFWALGDPIERIPGIGRRRGAALRRLGVERVEDLLTLWPRRHQDRTRLCSIADLKPGEEAAVVGRVTVAHFEPRATGQGLLRVLVNDGTGTLTAYFFHADRLRPVFAVGRTVLLAGRVEWRGRGYSMAHPDHAVLEPGESPELGLIPVYPTTQDLKPRWILQLMREWIPRLSAVASDPLPEWVRRRYQLPERGWALRHLHFPRGREQWEAARRRLVFDEFLRVALAVRWRSGRAPSGDGVRQDPDGPVSRGVWQTLPYDLTPGQRAAWEEIRQDLVAPRPMARLLQGEVGSGKTTLALLALAAGVDGGHQVAFMAPTELLAEQHYHVLRDQLEGLGVKVGFLSGQERGAGAVREELASGRLKVVVGTQALLSDQVRFADLGLIVVDEQHRFGVRQRARLSAKGAYPDLLVMTATPIPRTLALTIYGDLDLSRIVGLPPGRKPVKTVLLGRDQRREAYAAVWKAVRQGHQAYVVCPRVTADEEGTAAKAAQALAAGMQKVQGWRVGLLHGQLPLDAKARTMQAFRRHEIDVLVATSIIEVGVDVPNATVMVIENADRFGLAQLHQLRGRVGRGHAPGTCYLIAQNDSEEAMARLQAMVETQDGLELAERDLAQRGPGEILGLRQHGIAGFQLARPLEDLEWLQAARDLAQSILAADPRLEDPAHRLLRAWVQAALLDDLPGQVLH
ncbi:MAG: ATP-dependent DNA helicase RecG [Firmicutes bacterium]|nr:ATP-dependent DNA helicase RecG [Alicyclobacillaceae bacterium]MCL6496425.1 ATP-dependent DNA helicase RecG [Bacillota bacterium]